MGRVCSMDKGCAENSNDWFKMFEKKVKNAKLTVANFGL